MRAPALPRGFPTHLRMVPCRPRTFASCVNHRSCVSFGGQNSQSRRASTSSAASSSGSSSPFWNTSKAVLVSVFAASLGYAYAVSQSTRPKQPQYGSMKDFEKVSSNLYSPSCVYEGVLLIYLQSRPSPNYEASLGMTLSA